MDWSKFKCPVCEFAQSCSDSKVALERGGDSLTRQQLNAGPEHVFLRSRALDQPLQSYYASLESCIGYLLLLGGTRHFGYYDKDTYWPFPINGALRMMEDHLFDTLGLKHRAQVLDAGCGVAHVAIHMAEKGLLV
jgi:hypothetical protein